VPIRELIAREAGVRLLTVAPPAADICGKRTRPQEVYMHRRMLVAVVAVVAALAPSILAGAQAPPKRVVTLGILAPNAPKDARPVSIMTLEDGMAGMTVPDVGQFGFTPSFRKGDDKTVVVTIFDTSTKPGTELGSVDVVVGAKAAVQSKTKPSFGILVTAVK
jgi:hypothetical protein